MTARIAMFAAALALIAPVTAYAGNAVVASGSDRPTNPIKELADYTGLSERKVQMILGCRTCFAEYRYTFHRSVEQFKRELGDERYQQLISGQPIELDRGEPGVRVAAAGQ